MNPRNLQQSSGRKVYLEAARVIAIFFVIFNHTGTDGFFLFSQRTWGTASFFVYLFFSVFCKFSVPMFFMISGALMLNRENEPLDRLWKKRIGKNLLIILLFAAGNYCIDMLLSPDKADFGLILTSVLTGKLNIGYFWYGHLWFLYSYIGYLCCLPFLRAMVKNLDDRYFCYLIVLVLLIKGMIPAAEYLLGQGAVRMDGRLLPQWLAEDIVVYPCVGYYLEHRTDIQKQGKRLAWLWLANIAGIAVTALLIYRKAVATQILDESSSQGFHCMFVMLNCIAIYLSLKYLFAKIRFPQFVEKGILSVGGCTFGIYLFHMMVLDSPPMKKLLRCLLDLGVNNLIACFIQCGCVLLMAYGVTVILRKVPLFGKLLG